MCVIRFLCSYFWTISHPTEAIFCATMGKLKINFRTRRCVARANAVTRFIHAVRIFFFTLKQSNLFQVRTAKKHR